MATQKFRILTLSPTLMMVILFLVSAAASAQSGNPGNIMFRPMLGAKKVLFIRVNYPDNNRIVMTAQEAKEHADNLKAIFAANSYGAMDFEIDITPVLTMPQPSTFYSSLHNRTPFVRIRADAIKIAEDAGFHESDYDREIIFTKKAWPQVQTGIGGVNLRTCYVIENSPTLSAHELGHTFDWKHANFFWVAGANPIDSTGEAIDYGDRFDIMGDAFHFHHFNPWYKVRVGWLAPKNILTVSKSGVYTVRAMEMAPQAPAATGYHALRIRRDSNTGAMVSQMEMWNRSQALLLDMTPGSKGKKNKEYEDAALLPGKTIRDQEAGIEITVLDKFNDSLHVQVVVPTDAIDTLPIIDIINPKPGITVHGAIDYKATAYDPDVGMVNGAGIDTVTFVLSYTIGDETLLDVTPSAAAFTFIVYPLKTGLAT